jgi:hypothetical protein
MGMGTDRERNRCQSMGFGGVMRHISFAAALALCALVAGVCN